jgi:uncharacterized protein DUF1501
MSSQLEKINRELRKRAWTYETFFNRPHWTRRRFFELAGAGVAGAFLPKRYARAADITRQGMATRNAADNVIFILLAGAPSHTDTFDFKMVDGVTPASFAPDTFNDMLFPVGLLPMLATQINDFAIIRSMRSHALVHSLAQTWSQIGRNPAAALGNIAPNVGSIVAIEKDKERKPGQIFPPFVALNSGAAVGGGYFPASYAPFKVNGQTAGGLANTTHPDNQNTFNNRIRLLHSLDDSLRINSPLGDAPGDFSEFYAAAQGMMYNPVVNQSFGYTAANSQRYGNSALGNACLVASQVLRANQGTRFIQITSSDGWDMHQNIYAANTLPARARILDNAVANLIIDLKANGLFDRTLVVMAGEFGRTPGPLTAQAGRDHFPQQFAFVAGAGVRGGRAIGQTNERGSDTVDFGWSQGRYVYAEDIEATILSAIGIDWTTVRHDDPVGRGFEYVPQTGPWQFAPVNELWD